MSAWKEVRIDLEGEYVVGRGRMVLIGQELVEAIVQYNLKHSMVCQSVSHRPATPGFLCELANDHSGPHKANDTLRWWNSGYEWLDKRSKARWEDRLERSRMRGEGGVNVIDEVTSRP